MKEPIIIQGKIIKDWDHNDCMITIGESGRALSDWADDYLVGNKVTVRYWINDTELTKPELIANHIKHLVGATETEHSPRYSDPTGYLWTDEKFVIGGHDILDELSGYVGKYLYMEISIG